VVKNEIKDRNPDRVRAGRLGAVKRWGEIPRVVRIDKLTDQQRRVVLALIDLADAKTAEGKR